MEMAMMKKLIIISILLWSFNVKAEHNDPHKYIDHAWVATGGSFVISSITYKFLSEKTTIPLFWCKTISNVFAASTIMLLANRKESSDNFYSAGDMKATGLGVVAGLSISFSINQRSIPRNRIRKSQIINK